MTQHHRHDDRLVPPAAQRGRGLAGESYRNQRTLTGIAIATMVVIGCGLVAAALVAPRTPSANALPTPIASVDGGATSTPVTNVVAAAVHERATSAPPLTAAPPTPVPIPTQASPAPESPIQPAAEVRTGPAQEPLLFWQWGYVGRWRDDGFRYSTLDHPGPDWLVGSTVELRNRVGSRHVATVVECNGRLVLSPAPPYANGFEAYWYTDGAPFTFTETNDDSTLAAMNAALVDRDLDPADAVSYGAPLAADGSADRLLFYRGDGEHVWWIATFDVETSTFATLDGDPDRDPGYEMGIPPTVWTDLDQDGNLESVMFGGDTSFAMEWAAGSSIWDAGTPIC